MIRKEKAFALVKLLNADNTYLLIRLTILELNNTFNILSIYRNLNNIFTICRSFIIHNAIHFRVIVNKSQEVRPLI